MHAVARRCVPRTLHAGQGRTRGGEHRELSRFSFSESVPSENFDSEATFAALTRTIHMVRRDGKLPLLYKQYCFPGRGSFANISDSTIWG